MTPEEEEAYRKEVRARLQKPKDEQRKKEILREEEVRADGGELMHMAKGSFRTLGKLLKDSEK